MEECGWDGLDCVSEVLVLLVCGVLVFIVLLLLEELLCFSVDFLQWFSVILCILLCFCLDVYGQVMVFFYYWFSFGFEFWVCWELVFEVIGLVVMLEIDNWFCLQLFENDYCFFDVQSVVDYLGVLLVVECLDFLYLLWDVWGELLEFLEFSVLLLLLLVVGVVLLLVIFVLGVMVVWCKCEYSIFWFFEGFLLYKDVVFGYKGWWEFVGQDVLGMKNMVKGESLMGEVVIDWMDIECLEVKWLKVEELGMGLEEVVDCCQWI